MIAALRYEWARITTIRSSYWISAITIVVGTGISALIAWGFSATAADAGIDATDIPFVGALVVTQAAYGGAPYIVAFVMAILGVLAWGHEYRHGMIRATFTAVPSRTAVWLSKYIVTVAWAFVTMLLTFALSSVAGWIFLHSYGTSFTSSEVFKAEGRALLVSLMLVIFTMSATAIMRHQTAALVLLFIWPLIIESILSLVFVLVPALRDHIDWLRFLPFRALFQILENPVLVAAQQGGDGGGGPFSVQPLSLTEAVLTFGGYVAAVVVASLVLLHRRDA